jgi:hypothetical protein
VPLDGALPFCKNLGTLGLEQAKDGRERFQQNLGQGLFMTKKRRKLHGTVQKVIKPAFPHEKEKAEIGIQEADELYREIRVENVLTDPDGHQVRLKPGAEVDVVVEADSNATLKQPDEDSKKK